MKTIIQTANLTKIQAMEAIKAQPRSTIFSVCINNPIPAPAVDGPVAYSRCRLRVSREQAISVARNYMTRGDMHRGYLIPVETLTVNGKNNFNIG